MDNQNTQLTTMPLTAELQTQLQELSINQILREKPQSIKSLVAMDPKGVEDSIIYHLGIFNKMLADFKRMKEDMLEPARMLITASFNDLSMDDVRLCINNGIKGIYGELIVFDVAVLGKWLTTYKEQKRQASLTFTDKKEQKDNSPIIAFKDLPPDMQADLKGVAKEKTMSVNHEVDPEEEVEFLHGPKTRKHKRGKPLPPNEVEILGFDTFDFIRSKTRQFPDVRYKNMTFNVQTWQEYFVFSIYPDDKLYKELTEYLATL